ncbi:Uncharacterised protein r2_g1182 [Pycnogonum litorale]
MVYHHGGKKMAAVYFRCGIPPSLNRFRPTKTLRCITAVVIRVSLRYFSPELSLRSSFVYRNSVISFQFCQKKKTNRNLLAQVYVSKLVVVGQLIRCRKVTCLNPRRRCK